MSQADNVIHEFRPSWSAWAFIIAITCGLALPWVWWKRLATKYRVTEHRVVRKTGVFTTSTDEFRLDRVTRIQTSQSYTERYFGVGSITLDAGVDEMTMESVPNYETVAESIREAQRQSQAA